jgi:hypothetical protein
MPLPAITAALVTLAQTALTTTCDVWDGEPSLDQAIGDTYMVIGSGLEQGTSDSNNSLGLRTQWDVYDLVCYVRHTSGDVAVADDRNAVWTAYSTFRNVVQRDPTLGGAITGGGWIEPTGAEYGQTTPEDLDEDAEGTYAEVMFRFTVHELVRAT